MSPYRDETSSRDSEAHKRLDEVEKDVVEVKEYLAKRTAYDPSDSLVARVVLSVVALICFTILAGMTISYVFGG